MIRSYHHPTVGEVRYQPSPMKLSDWEFPTRHAPMLGEHTAPVLRGVLGKSSSDIDELESNGITTVWRG